MSHNLSSTGSTNTLSCLNKRPWIISRWQFLKYTEITFLHRELLKRPASLKKDWKVITAIKIKQKVKKKKNWRGESEYLLKENSTQSCNTKIGDVLVGDPLPVSLNSIYILGFFGNALDLGNYIFMKFPGEVEAGRKND